MTTVIEQRGAFHFVCFPFAFVYSVLEVVLVTEYIRAFRRNLGLWHVTCTPYAHAPRTHTHTRTRARTHTER